MLECKAWHRRPKIPRWADISLAYAYPIRILKRMGLEYDPERNAANLRKHGVAFDDAQMVLFDTQALVREDIEVEGEQRFVAVGADALGRILTVVYTYREPDIIRLISARPATKRERQVYEA